MGDNTHFENLRRDEEQARHERVVNSAFAGDATSDDPAAEEGHAPGHLGNDTSGMTLLQDNLEELTHQEREPNQDVQQALEDLSKLHIREAIDRADG